MKNKILRWAWGILPVLLFCNKAEAQMEVSGEPHHRVLYKNEFVRVLDLKIPAADTTLPHRHEEQSVIIFLTQSVFGIQNTGGPVVMTPVKTGDLLFRAYGEKPVTHIVWNPENSLFHCLVVEILKKNPGMDSCSVLKDKALNFLWQNSLLSAYKAEISGDAALVIQGSNCSYLLIVISGSVRDESSGTERILQPGDFVWLPSKSPVKIKAANVDKADCVLLRLK
jgi:hypothetical protein